MATVTITLTDKSDSTVNVEMTTSGVTDEDDCESYALQTAIWLTGQLIKAREEAAKAAQQA